MILFAAVPTSIEIVPTDVTGPPVKPVPVTTFVTVPLVAGARASHCEIVVFHVSTLPGFGVPDATALPWILLTVRTPRFDIEPSPVTLPATQLLVVLL